MYRITAALLQANVDLDFGAGLAGGGVSAFLTTLVVGGILVALAPRYTTDRMTDVAEDPAGSAVYGLLSLVLLAVVVAVLVVTLVGIVVAVPLLLVAYLVWAVGSAVAFLAVADRFVGREDGWLVPLLVAAGINGLLTVTGIGGIVTLVVGATGFGAVLRHHL